MLWGLQDTAGILTNRVLRTRYVSRLDRDASDAICCSSARTTSGTDWIAKVEEDENETRWKRCLN
jgi:hypothetical protein